MNRKSIDMIRAEISHTSDGPITAFVLVSRAMRMTRSCADEVVANALYEELEARGMLVKGDVEVPGS